MDDMMGFESGGWDDLGWRDWSADTWGGGGYDWSGMPDYQSPAPEQQPGGYQTMGGGGGEYYSPGDVAPGSGMYSIGGGDWNPVQSTPQTYSEGMVSNGGGYTPGGASAADNWLKTRAANAASSWADYNSIFPAATPNAAGGGNPAPQRSTGGGMGGSTALQPYQKISMGTPERTMYDLYTNILKNPSQLTNNPAYEYLYNQGMQSLGRSLAAKRMQFSGNAMQEFQKQGQGIAANFANQMIPQYQAGAREELSRFMGPAGLLPNYASTNNSATARTNNETMAYNPPGGTPDMSGWGGSPGGGATSNIGMGGISQGYNPVGVGSRSGGSPAPSFNMSQFYNDPSQFDYTGYDIAGGPAYG